MSSLENAVEAIKQANYLIVTSGAGLGVDSGLPDFRGSEGFWKSYPPIAKKGLTFPETSNPRWFHKDPKFAWGFYGHRYHLYKDTYPHQGFHILKKWCEGMSLGYSIFTSNVDGHFQKAGFPEERIQECHGSINYLQCVDDYKCSGSIWPAGDLRVKVDENFQAKDPLPKCIHCSGLARPNILMFDDYTWVPHRTENQEKNFEQDLGRVLSEAHKVVIIEIGAGEAVPTVREFGQELLDKVSNSVLIRVNPRDPTGSHERLIKLPMKGLQALEEIDCLLNNKWPE